MVVSDDATLVEFDADAAVSAAREASDGSIHLAVEYTTEEFHTLYADEVTTALCGDREEMAEHFEEVHAYVHADFTEREMFADLFRGAGEVRSFVTYMDRVTLVRVLIGQQGLFLTTDPDADVTAVVEAVESRLE